ncbi:PepSY domain-containing protein [[Kitasatospora] papulosa]|uniref:PepSY domain-containing protein n=1 Tax=[Kitasatospora] papulosa TaxID=1464011 RepID=UPI003688458A
MKRNIAVATLTAAVLVGGGLVATAAFADSDSDGKDDRTAAADRAAGDTGAAGRVGVDGAVAAALKAVPGTVTEAERDEDDDDRARAVWELDVYGSDRVWHDVTVDASSGKVLSDREDDGDDRDRHAPRSSAVSLDAAVKAALGAQAGTVTSVDLDDDGDDDDDDRGERAPHWDVDVTGKDGKQHELRVDAKSGKVTVDRDDNDGDDD